MAEYIKREYAVDAVLDVYYDTPDIDLSGEKFEAAMRALLNEAPEQVGYSREDAADCIRYMDAADVAPVRHGRWDDEHKCTVCHNEAFYKISNIRPDYDYDWEENLVETGDYIWDIEWVETAYCPNCGCKMDLEG